MTLPKKDKHGIEIEEFDVLKVNHFIGARRRRYYMYKWVRMGRHGILEARHLSESNSAWQFSHDKRVVLDDVEIVQSNRWEKLP